MTTQIATNETPPKPSKSKRKSLREISCKKHMDKLADIAASHGGRIAKGSVYVNGKTKMFFFDANGNLFAKTPKAVKQGGWSPFEGRNRAQEICRPEWDPPRWLENSDILDFWLEPDSSDECHADDH